MTLILRKILGLLSIALGLYFIYIITNILKEITNSDENYFLLFSIPLIFLALGIKGIFYRKIDNTTHKIYGSLYKRLSAFLIDCVIFSVPYLFIYYYYPSYYILFIVITMPIYPFISLFFLIKFEATPGKIFLGLKVLSENFQKLNLKQAILRTIIDIIFGIILTLGYLQAMFEVNINPLEIVNLDKYFEELKTNFSSVYNFFDISNYFWLISEFIVINFNFKKKAIHDYISNSVVVNVNLIE